MTPEEIVSLTAEERVAVEDRAKSGDMDAVKDFVFVSAWRAILKDEYVPADKRVETFKALYAEVAVAIEKGEATAGELIQNG